MVRHRRRYATATTATSTDHRRSGRHCGLQHARILFHRRAVDNLPCVAATGGRCRYHRWSAARAALAFRLESDLLLLAAVSHRAAILLLLLGEHRVHRHHGRRRLHVHERRPIDAGHRRRGWLTRGWRHRRSGMVVVGSVRAVIRVGGMAASAGCQMVVLLLMVMWMGAGAAARVVAGSSEAVHGLGPMRRRAAGQRERRVGGQHVHVSCIVSRWEQLWVANN